MFYVKCRFCVLLMFLSILVICIAQSWRERKVWHKFIYWLRIEYGNLGRVENPTPVATTKCLYTGLALCGLYIGWLYTGLALCQYTPFGYTQG